MIRVVAVVTPMTATAVISVRTRNRGQGMGGPSIQRAAGTLPLIVAIYRNPPPEPPLWAGVGIPARGPPSPTGRSPPTPTAAPRSTEGFGSSGCGGIANPPTGTAP